MVELDANTIAIVKSTAPVLAEHGQTIIDVFYAHLFENYEVCKGIFNMSHQRRDADGRSGPQPGALATAVHAYAANIDNLPALLPAIEIMVHKHVSVGVDPALYPIVGQGVLAAIKEVLGAAATDEVIGAWGIAYTFLADLLIAKENELREQLKAQEGGYSTFTKMVVAKKVKESDEVTSFYLKREGNEKLPTYKPGQYLSFKFEIPGQEHPVVRNYSLSCAPGSDHFRISVKKEAGTEDYPAGIASGYLHDQIEVGATLMVGPPCGHFTLKEDLKSLVLISGGIGQTPLLSMFEASTARETKLPVRFIHFARNPAVHALSATVDEIAGQHESVHAYVYYAQGGQNSELKNTIVGSGHFDQVTVKALLPADVESEIYVCGPPGFMNAVVKGLGEVGVAPERIHFEHFSPELGAGP